MFRGFNSVDSFCVNYSKRFVYKNQTTTKTLPKEQSKKGNHKMLKASWAMLKHFPMIC